MNCINSNRHRDELDLLDLLDPKLGAARRDELVDQLINDPRAAQELRLLMALDSAAESVAKELKPASGMNSRWLRLGAPVAAATLLLLAWPQHVRQGQRVDAVASVSESASDELFSVSFEAPADKRFVGGFE